MKRPKKLSAAFVKTMKRPGRYGDGRGGFELVPAREADHYQMPIHDSEPKTADSWSPVNVGLDAYPVMTLAEAREKALKNRRMVAQGTGSPVGWHPHIRRGRGDGDGDSPAVLAVGRQVRSPMENRRPLVSDGYR